MTLAEMFYFLDEKRKIAEKGTTDEKETLSNFSLAFFS